MSNNYYIIPVFIPHLGCPNDCVFCNQKRITGNEKQINIEDIKNHVNRSLNTIRNNPEIKKEIAFFGGSFTGIDIDLQTKLLKLASSKKKVKKIDKIRLSTRPDYINENILKLLNNFSVDIIELGVQSLDDEVLKLSCRGHSSEDVFEAVKLIKKFKFTLGIQLMTGLPGDNKEKLFNTANKVINLKPDFVRIYPTLVVKDTALEEMYKKGIYKPDSLKTTVENCKQLLLMFENKGIKVIRIGLQPTENINEDGDIVAGPFHPSIRELIESEIIFDKVSKILDTIDDNIKNIDIIINSKKISTFVGQKKVNLTKLKDKYNIGNINIIQEDISKNIIKLIINTKVYTINNI